MPPEVRSRHFGQIFAVAAGEKARKGNSDGKSALKSVTRGVLRVVSVKN